MSAVGKVAQRGPSASAMVLLALLSLLAVFGLDLAMGAAFIDPNKGIRSALYHHDLRPDFVGVDDWNGHVYRMATNSLGFKDAAPRTVPLRDPRHRILFPGDSFTEGLGVPFEETFPALLWDRLGRDRTEILNAGVMFYTPKLEALKLAHLVEAVGLLVQEVVLLYVAALLVGEAVASLAPFVYSLY